MNDVIIASTEADSAAAESVVRHHAQLADTLEFRVEALVGAAASGDDLTARAARAGLVHWCERELVPHALAEERAMYPAAHAKPEGRLLVDGMLYEHKVIIGLIDEISRAAHFVRAAAAAKALLVMFEAHLVKENELVLPLLAAAPEVSVADLLVGMHELLGATENRARTQPVDHAPACGCGEADGAGHPELDARPIPHAIRHATIFGALDAVGPGHGLVLIASHDPLPLLAQIQQRSPDVFQVDYLDQGPQIWRLRFLRHPNEASVPS
jgi:uncharacterized protein (DUF2249 family)